MSIVALAQLIRFLCPSVKDGDKLEKLSTNSLFCSWYTSEFRVIREESTRNLSLLREILFESKHEKHVGTIVVLTVKVVTLLPPIISS